MGGHQAKSSLLAPAFRTTASNGPFVQRVAASDMFEIELGDLQLFGRSLTLCSPWPTLVDLGDKLKGLNQ